MVQPKPPWAPPLVDLPIGAAGDLVRAVSLCPLEPPEAYQQVPRRVRGLDGQIRDGS